MGPSAFSKQVNAGGRGVGQKRLWHGYLDSLGGSPLCFSGSPHTSLHGAASELAWSLGVSVDALGPRASGAAPAFDQELTLLVGLCLVVVPAEDRCHVVT